MKLRLLAGVLWGVTLIAGFTAGQLWMSARELRARLQHSLARPEGTGRTSPSANPSAAGGSGTTRVPNSVPVLPGSDSASFKHLADQARASQERRKELLESIPSLQVLHEQRRRLQHRADYASFFRKRTLSFDQEEAFIDEMVKWDMEMLDLSAVAKKQGFARGDAAWKARRDEAEKAFIGALKSLLGPDAVSVLQDYNRLGDARSYVASYAGFASRVGQPLTLAQVEGVVALFDAVVADGKAVQTSLLTSSQWQQVLDRARPLLSASQWENFATIAPPGPGVSGNRFQSTYDRALQQALARPK
ncbi:MAG: hypothetical protein JNN01_07725 [Opitutaceae bacterium]|nr:hypothetical protein [Opitutaceae bacterium]